ncbi:peptidoglycan editing factor PgeF [Jeotgalibacillus sp. S-D1]|nr:peptidoglycan editing factor PgeF [Jeotgalibacillus sp. S-D1]
MTKEHSPAFLSIDKWKSEFPSLVAAFSTKNGGVSQGSFRSLNVGLHVNDMDESVIRNREILSEACSSNLSQWVFADQVHGSAIKRTGHFDRGKGTLSYQEALPETDGLWTMERNVFLSLCFADCVPIYFVEPQTQFIGIAHAGWKGTVQNIAGRMINEAIEAGVAIGQIQAFIGPSIGDCCYVVDDIVIQEVKNCLSEMFHSSFSKQSKGQYTLDLKAVNEQLLLNAGLAKEQIAISSYCTSCEESLFFSHRKDKGKTGRMAAVIGWKE